MPLVVNLRPQAWAVYGEVAAMLAFDVLVVVDA